MKNSYPKRAASAHPEGPEQETSTLRALVSKTLLSSSSLPRSMKGMLTAPLMPSFSKRSADLRSTIRVPPLAATAASLGDMNLSEF